MAITVDFDPTNSGSTPDIPTKGLEIKVKIPPVCLIGKGRLSVKQFTWVQFPSGCPIESRDIKTNWQSIRI